MASSSPSEFLTFFRRAATGRALHHRSVAYSPARSFALSACRQQETPPKKKHDLGGPAQNKKHATEKGVEGEPNIQAYESKAGRE